MQEKKQQPKVTNNNGGGSGSIFDAAGSDENKNVSVSSGPYMENLPVAGMTVEQVRQRFSDQMDISADAAAVINGIGVDNSYTLKPGENLAFIQHAGEKGGQAKIVINDGEATFYNGETVVKSAPVSKLFACTQLLNTGDIVLPAGTKAVLSRGPITVTVWEKPPHIAKLRWIRADSPQPYGPGTKYRDVRIALPYLVLLSVFSWNGNNPVLIKKDECFFRAKPIDSLDDTLHYPALLNCSKFHREEGNPLSWICTQYLKTTKKMRSKKPGDAIAAAMEAVRYCLLDTGFNLSSEHHEGNSWYGASKHIDERISTIERWEEETAKNPLFVLDVPWTSTGLSVSQVVERIFKNQGAVTGAVAFNANDVARMISHL